MKTVTAIVLSSLIFGLYHGNMVQFLYASLLGSLLAVIYHRTGTLWTSILAHMAGESVESVWRYLVGKITGKPSVWSGNWNFAGTFVCVIPAYWIFANKRK